MQPLETARLAIRNFTADDWRALQALVIAHGATAVAKYDHAWPTDEATIRGVAQWFAAGESYMAVCLKETGQLLGYLALNPLEGEGGPAFDLGYNLHPGYRGQGYGSEAAAAAVAYAFGALGAARLVAGTAAANTPSVRLLARLGFVEMGRSMASFAKDEAGKPVEFEGLSFELRRERWAGC